jgi:peptidoglycan/xylan/chitin deacetylase (PgdA/CDA1 family)
MQNAGMTIGGHSKSHPTLVDIHNENILRNELVDSKKVIESHIGRTVDLFAYPFGHPNDEIIKVLKEAGYKAARTTYIGSVHTLDNIYTLKGIIVDQNFDNFVKSLQTI